VAAVKCRFHRFEVFGSGLLGVFVCKYTHKYCGWCVFAPGGRFEVGVGLPIAKTFPLFGSPFLFRTEVIRGLLEAEDSAFQGHLSVSLSEHRHFPFHHPYGGHQTVRTGASSLVSTCRFKLLCRRNGFARGIRTPCLVQTSQPTQSQHEKGLAPTFGAPQSPLSCFMHHSPGGWVDECIGFTDRQSYGIHFNSIWQCTEKEDGSCYEASRLDSIQRNLELQHEYLRSIVT
jgi:hypothetical protein